MKRSSGFLLALTFLLVIVLGAYGSVWASAATLDVQADVNHDGIVNEADLFYIEQILAGQYTDDSADLDGNHLVEQLDKHILENVLNGMIPVQESDDLLNYAEEITISGQTGNATAQLQSTIAKADSHMALEYRCRGANGMPVVEISFATAQDFTAADVISMDVLFVNEPFLQYRQFQVSVVTGEELNQSNCVNIQKVPTEQGWTRSIVPLYQIKDADMSDVRAIRFHFDALDADGRWADRQPHRIYIDNVSISTYTFESVSLLDVSEYDQGSYVTVKLQPDDAQDVYCNDTDNPYFIENISDSTTLNGQKIIVKLRYSGVTNSVTLEFDEDTKNILSDAIQLQQTVYIKIGSGALFGFNGGNTWTIGEDLNICTGYQDDGTLFWQVCTHSHTEGVPQIVGLEYESIHNFGDDYFYINVKPINQPDVYSRDYNWPYMVGTFSDHVTVNGEKASLTIQYPYVRNRLYLKVDAQTKTLIENAKMHQNTVYITIEAGSTFGLNESNMWVLHKDLTICNSFDDNGNMTWQVCQHTVHIEQTEIDIVDNGRSAYCIVIPENATDCEQFAASELQSFLYQTTGVNLPIKKDTDTSVGAFALSVGNTQRLKNSGFTLENGTTKDVYAITNKGYTLYLYGNTDRAALYSVYEFLECYTGVRFVAADYTYIPQCEKITIEKNMHKRFDSVVDLRMYWTCDSMYDALYAARKRLVAHWNFSEPKYGEGLYRDYNAQGHNTRSLIQAGLAYYGLTEIPDYVYATDLEGNRLSEQIGSDTVWDICWSDGIADDGTFIEELRVDSNGNVQPTVAQLLLAGLKAQVDSNKTATIFNVSQEDNRTVICNCTQCNGRTQNYGAYSGNIVRMANALAIELNDYTHSSSGDGRDIKLLTNAYFYSQEAPVLGTAGNYYTYDASVIPNAYTIIQYATMNYCNHALGVADPIQPDEHKDCINKWQWLCSNYQNLLLYTYSTNFNCSFTYNPNLDGLMDTFYYSIENLSNTMLVFEGDAYSDEWQQSLRAYIISELFWDPNADVQALLEEFVTLYYGRSAPVVQAYIDRMEQLCDNNRATYGSDFHLLVADHIDYEIHRAEFWPLEQLELSIQELNAELAAIAADDTLSQAEKERLTAEVEQVLIAPMMQVKYQYSTYYKNRGGEEAYEEELRQLVAKHPAIYNQAKAWELLSEADPYGSYFELNFGNDAVLTSNANWATLNGTYKTKMKVNGVSGYFMDVRFQYCGDGNRVYVYVGTTTRAWFESELINGGSLIISIPKGATFTTPEGKTYTLAQELKLCSTIADDGSLQWSNCSHSGHFNINYIESYGVSGFYVRLLPYGQSDISYSQEWVAMTGSYLQGIQVNGQNMNVPVKYTGVANRIYVAFDDAAVQNVMLQAQQTQTTVWLTIPAGSTFGFENTNSWVLDKDLTFCCYYDGGSMVWQVCTHKSHEPTLSISYIQEFSSNYMIFNVTTSNQPSIYSDSHGNWPYLVGTYSEHITVNGKKVTAQIQWPDVTNRLYLKFDSATQTIISDATELQAVVYITMEKGATLGFDENHLWELDKDLTVCSTYDAAGKIHWQICSHSHTEPVPQITGLSLGYIGTYSDADMYINLKPHNQPDISSSMHGNWPYMVGSFVDHVTVNGQKVSLQIQWPDVTNRLYLKFDAATQNMILDAKNNHTILHITIAAGSTIGFDSENLWVLHKDLTVCNAFDSEGNMVWQICSCSNA